METHNPLYAGAAAADVTPAKSLFLFGYPNVQRDSTGVNDPLLASALFLNDGATRLLFIGCDVIFVDRDLANRARRRIEQETTVSASHIMITATHTHSAPMTVAMLSNADDSSVPTIDQEYLAFLEDGIVSAGVAAVRQAAPAEIGLAMADGSCVGTNRLDPNGPSDPATTVLTIRDKQSQRLAALMVICAMHPTVLREGSTLVSGDFPGMTRKYLQEHVLGGELPVIYHTAPCGNLSPRHVVRENTVAEATRLGNLLGEEIQRAVAGIVYADEAHLHCQQAFLQFPTREFPSVAAAEELKHQAESALIALRCAGADPRIIRTAECKCFGAEETLALSRAAEQDRLKQAVETVLPAELSVFRVGPWAFVGWPGEQFVELSLEVKSEFPNSHLISMANGELQGYLVTEEAVQQQTYESLNALFASPASGQILVARTKELLGSRSA